MKMRHRADEVALQKAQAVQTLDNLLSEQAALTEQIEQLGHRVDVVYANAQRAYGAVGADPMLALILSDSTETGITHDILSVLTAM
jgi:hypothetical protein